MFTMGRFHKSTRKELDDLIAKFTENPGIRLDSITTFTDMVDYIANKGFKVGTDNKENKQRKENYRYLKSGF